jgi:hypothetical protein
MPDPESALRLCLCSRWNHAAAGELALQARQPGWSWEAAAACAFSEGLAPLLYAQLSPTDLWPAISPGVRDALALAYEGSAIRSAVLFTALEELLGRLNRAGVPVLLLKGAALAGVLYGDPALRPMRDLDLLVPETEAGHALAVLAACGYTATHAEARPGSRLAWENELLLSKPGVIGIAVELHWRPFDAPFYQQRLRADWFWATATPVAVGAARALTLGPEAQFLYLAGHLMLHHRGQGLRWWLDLAELLRHARGALDWQTLLARAEADALVIPLQEALAALVGVWGVRIAPEILAQAAALQPSAAERRAYGHLTAAQRPVAQRFWADLTGLPTWADRGRFAWAHIVPTPAYMLGRYHPPHPWLTPLLYPWRWLTGLAGALTYLASAACQRPDR